MCELKQVLRRFLSLLLVTAMTLSLLPQIRLTAYAAQSGSLTGLSNSDIGASYTATDDGINASWLANGNAVTGSVIGTAGTCSNIQYETTLTITNNKPGAAILSFDYTIAQNSGTIQVAGAAVTANGSYSGELEAGGTIKIYLKSGSTSAATSISITNLNLLTDVEATTTFHPAVNGGYTVDGEEIVEEVSKTQRSTVSYTVTAVPASGYKFVGWYSETESKYLSSDTSASLNFDSDQTVTAVFTEEINPVFDVGGAKFIDLNEADTYAGTNGLGKITLVSDGVLNGGSYTISKGITLLIPFDAAGTCYTTTPATVGNSWTSPSVYRRLTMKEGASVIVEGAISISAKHTAKGNGLNGEPGGGAPSGPYGYVVMEDGSSITVTGGGRLYVWGYLSGAGTVTAESGAAIYENMQIKDFRGGSASSSLATSAKNKAFLFNQYFIQNIEAKLIIKSGADEYIYTSLYASNKSTSTAVHFIGDGGMFTVEDGGTFTKKYLPESDRMEITVEGNASVNNLSLSLMGISVSSQDYVLPINNSMTLKILSGTTRITQDVALLPAVRVEIARDAKLEITNGSNVYVYDRDEWMGNNFAAGNFKAVTYSPTRAYSRKDADLIDACVDVNGTVLVNGYFYTTESGADIKTSEGTGNLVLAGGSGSNTETYQVSGAQSSPTSVPITSAKLHNGSQYAGTEEEYTLTDGAAAGSVYYWDTEDSKWKPEGGAETITVTFDANEGEGSMEVQTVENGVDTPLASNLFTREGYTFNGWNTQADGNGTPYGDGAVVNLTENTTLYAQWQTIADTYTVTWVDEDGTVLETDENMEYGATPEYNGETPAKAGDDQYSYTFKGWTPEISEVTADITYKAVYEQTVNQYTIIWKNWDGTELSSEQVAYGEIPVYNGETPEREGDEEYTYSFSGWMPEITAVTADAEYTAAFTDTINTYTVTWVDEDGTVLETDEEVEYGTIPEYNGETPAKEGDDQYSYIFKGWSPAMDTVTGDITYTAVYEQNVNQYAVTWKNWDGTELRTDQVAYGEMPVYAGETPVKEGDEQYRYTFLGWSPEITAVTGNAEYTAEFDETVRTFTVTWINADGTELEKDEEVAYGAAPEYNGEIPVKEEDAQNSYIFKGWSPEITDETIVTDNMIYTAVYETIVKTYTITWVDEDGTELEKDEDIAYGRIPVYNGETPAKAADGENTYIFKGWEPEVTAVTEDAVYRAVYTAIPIVKHTVTFDANGGEGTMEPQTFVQGEDSSLNANAFTRTDYQFAGWNTSPDGQGEDYADEGSIINLTEDITLYAQWKFWNGWLTDENGTTYYVEGEQIYFSNWAVIDGNTYYFDETGYIVKGIRKAISADGTYEAQFIFDSVTGIFQKEQNGLYNVNADTYWTCNGEIVENAGLQRVVTDTGEVTYYYFGEDSKAYKATEDTNHYTVEKNNGFALPAGINYVFGEDGVIVHFADTSINGIYFDEDSSNYYYCVDGVIIADGLMLIDGSYYYARTSTGAFVRNCSYWITRTHDLLEEGTYTFDEYGKIVFPEESEKKNGIVEENGSLYYYVDGILTGAGLIQIGDDYYYVKTSNGEVVHGRTYWITMTNDLLPSGVYTFDEDGRIMDPSGSGETEVKDGIVEENGSLYYYADGVLTGAGLIQIDGDYYYVRTSNGEVVHGRTYWITVTNDLLPSKQYTFADDGRMLTE